MDRSLRLLPPLLVALAIACSLGACNTMSGLGKDTQKAGEKLEEEAERHIDEPADESAGESAGDHPA